MIERTLFIIKPDAVKRNLVSPILKDLRDAGLKIVTQKKVQLQPEQLAKLYEQHQGRDYYNGLIKYMGSGVAVCGIIDGENVIKRLRDLMGNTYPSKAAPDTIRGKYRPASDIGSFGVIENMIHGSDSPERAAKEIGFIFSKELAV